MACLVGILMISYQIGVSKNICLNNYISSKISALEDSVRGTMDSDREDGQACTTFSNTTETSDVMYLNDFSADTLIRSTHQNRDMAYKMVESYFQGVQDANSNFNVKKGHRAGVLVVTAVCSPLLTAIPVAIASGIAPSSKNLHVNPSKLNNASYMRGYKYQAHAIKKKELWGSFVGGGTPWCIVAGFLLL